MTTFEEVQDNFAESLTRAASLIKNRPTGHVIDYRELSEILTDITVVCTMMADLQDSQK